MNDEKIIISDFNSEGQSWLFIKGFLDIPAKRAKAVGIIDCFSVTNNTDIVQDFDLDKQYVFLICDAEKIPIEKYGVEVTNVLVISTLNNIVFYSQYIIFIYNITDFKDDINLILTGNHSKISGKGKDILLKNIPEFEIQRGARVRNGLHMIFNPTSNDKAIFAKALGIKVNDLPNGEIFSAPDIQDECLVYSHMMKESITITELRYGDVVMCEVLSKPMIVLGITSKNDVVLYSVNSEGVTAVGPFKAKFVKAFVEETPRNFIEKRSIKFSIPVYVIRDEVIDYKLLDPYRREILKDLNETNIFGDKMNIDVV